MVVNFPEVISIPLLTPGDLLKTANENGHFPQKLTQYLLGKVTLNVLQDAAKRRAGMPEGEFKRWDRGVELQSVVVMQPVVYVSTDVAADAAARAGVRVGGGVGNAAGVVVARGNSKATFAQAVRAICEGKVTVDAHGNLNMPKDIDWPFASNPFLYVRAAYEPLYRVVLKELKKYATPPRGNQFPRRIVTGQPGIGKSVFAWYVIYRLLTGTPRRNILYIYGANKSMYIIDAETATVTYVGSTTNEKDVYERYNDNLEDGMVIIADSFVPVLPDAECSILVVSSPGRIAVAKKRGAGKDNWNNYMSFHGQPLYMPYPSIAEIRELRKAFKETITTDVFNGRLAYWGRIPRRLFSTELDEFYAQPALDLSVKKIFNAANYIPHSGQTTKPAFDAPHRYIVQRTVGDVFDEENAKSGSEERMAFTEAYFQPARLTYFTSRAFYQLAMKKDAERNWRMCERLAKGLSDAEFVRGAMGSIFEARAKVVLSRGGKFFIRDLRTGAQKEVTVTAGEPQIFDSVATLEAIRAAQATRIPLVPLKANFPSMDIICEVDGLDGGAAYVPMNMTIGARHAINGTGMKRVAAALKWNDGRTFVSSYETRSSAGDASTNDTERPFIFVIPAELYDGRRAWMAGSVQAVGIEYPAAQYGALHQYVMRVDAKAIAPPSETLDRLFWKAANRWDLSGMFPVMPERPDGAPDDGEDDIGDPVVPAAMGGAGAPPGT